MEELRTIRTAPLAQSTVMITSWREQWLRLAQHNGSTLTRSEILTAYGQTEESIKEHTVNLAIADAKRIFNKSGDKAKQKVMKQIATPGPA